MRLNNYLKEHLVFIMVNLFLFLFLSVGMVVVGVPIINIFGLFMIWFSPVTSFMVIQYLHEKKFFDELISMNDSLDKKYLLSEVIKYPSFLEGKIFFDILKKTNKNMLEHVNEFEEQQIEYREYIETWVHEIKTPIASAKIIIDNNKNLITKSIDSEIKRIDDYVEQALYYSKSNTVNEDYIIRCCSLVPLLEEVIQSNSRELINRNFSLELLEVDRNIYSDPKWIKFILNQIIGNAIKYSGETNRKIVIDSVENANNIVLSIKDNGIGISGKDIEKIFVKGFTGQNGRQYGKSTGIGLYLCKKLCVKLGLGLALSSEIGKYTVVHITFPKGKFNTIIE